MAIVLESISTKTLAAGSSTTITKPTGLAVGDVMVALIGSVFPFAGAGALDVPSGWTAVQNGNYSVSVTTFSYAIFTKTANSSDVAASNFTFNHTTFGRIMGGAIARVSGFGLVDDSAFVASTGAPPTAVASTIAPTLPNSLNLVILLAGDNTSAGGSVSFSNPALATNDPTWTEHLDSAVSDGNARYGIAVYSAPRAQATAWGNITLTYVQNTNADIGAAIINIAPQVNGTHTVTTAPMYVVNQPFLRTGALTLQGNDPTTDSFNKTAWQNESTSSTAWQNEEY